MGECAEWRLEEVAHRDYEKQLGKRWIDGLRMLLFPLCLVYAKPYWNITQLSGLLKTSRSLGISSLPVINSPEDRQFHTPCNLIISSDVAPPSPSMAESRLCCMFQPFVSGFGLDKQTGIYVFLFHVHIYIAFFLQLIRAYPWLGRITLRKLSC